MSTEYKVIEPHELGALEVTEITSESLDGTKRKPMQFVVLQIARTEIALTAPIEYLLRSFDEVKFGMAQARTIGLDFHDFDIRYKIRKVVDLGDGAMTRILCHRVFLHKYWIDPENRIIGWDLDEEGLVVLLKCFQNKEITRDLLFEIGKTHGVPRVVSDTRLFKVGGPFYEANKPGTVIQSKKR
jgi:hypothetical protein